MDNPEVLEKEAIRSGLQYLLRIWPNAIRLDDPTINVWADALEGMSPRVFESVIKGWVRKGKKFPVPAELLESARDVFAAQAATEWEILSAWISQGAYQQTWDQLSVSDRAKTALRAVGGVQRIQDCKPGDVRFIRADFLQAWVNPPASQQFETPRYTNPEEAPPTSDQIAATRQLIKQLKARYDL